MSNSATIENLATIQQDKDIKNEEVAIKVENLSKVYRLYDTPLDRLKESLHPFKKKYHREFYALRDVNFEVKRGETVGIIGKNGSGKSTLLKIITGVLTPTSGNVTVNGKISALLELGTGFNPEFTGIENIYFSGTIMGYTKEEIDKKIDDIVAFADIGDFIKQPVKTYSSGMLMRLGFSVAVNMEPEILIVDEALSVGDIRFRQKSMRKMKELMETAKAILIVSHDVKAITNFCNRAIWLKEGQLYQSGDPMVVTNNYHTYMCHETMPLDVAERNSVKNTSDNLHNQYNELVWEEITNNKNINGDLGAEIKKVTLYTKIPFEKTNVLHGGEDVIYIIDIDIKTDIEYPFIGWILYDTYNNALCGGCTYYSENNVTFFHKGQRILSKFEFKFPRMHNGTYIFSAGISSGTLENRLVHFLVYDAYVIQIINGDIRANMGGYFIIDDIKMHIAISL